VHNVRGGTGWKANRGSRGPETCSGRGKKVAGMKNSESSKFELGGGGEGPHRQENRSMCKGQNKAREETEKKW